MLVKNKKEPWGQTVSRFLDSDGLLVGLTFTPSNAGKRAVNLRDVRTIGRSGAKKPFDSIHLHSRIPMGQAVRSENPGKYDSYVDLVPGQWTKLKIEVEERSARLYVNEAEQPTLIVNDLKQPCPIAAWHCGWDKGQSPILPT
jgi:hypothetical protein